MYLQYNITSDTRQLLLNSLLLSQLFSRWLISSEASVIGTVCNTAIKIGKRFYVEQTLTAIDGMAAEIVMNYITGDMFYLVIPNSYYSKLYVLEDGSKDSIEITGIKEQGQSVAVDNENNIVYLSGDNGLYVYDRESNTAVPFAHSGLDIIHLYFSKSVIYAVERPNYEVYKLMKKGKRKTKIDIIRYGNGIVVDGSDNYLFAHSDDSVYMLLKGFTEMIKIVGIRSGEATALAVDREDRMYIAAGSKIYRVRVDNSIPEYEGSTGFNVTAINFDMDNNYILGKKNNIVKLKQIHC